jgi:uncharacterized membrane protein
VKVNRRFRGACRLRLQGQRASQASALIAVCFMLVSCLAYSSTVKTEAISASKCRLTFTRLHGVISQKTDIFIVTAVKTSNPKQVIQFSCHYFRALMLLQKLMLRNERNSESLVAEIQLKCLVQSPRGSVRVVQLTVYISFCVRKN